MNIICKHKKFYIEETNEQLYTRNQASKSFGVSSFLLTKHKDELNPISTVDYFGELYTKEDILNLKKKLFLTKEKQGTSYYNNGERLYSYTDVYRNILHISPNVLSSILKKDLYSAEDLNFIKIKLDEKAKYTKQNISAELGIDSHKLTRYMKYLNISSLNEYTINQIKELLNNKEVSSLLRQKTCIEKYGVSSYTKTNDYKTKVKQTNKQKYGVASPLQNKEILIKRNQTNIERYGVEHIPQNDDIHQKIFSYKKINNNGYLSRAEKKFAEMLTNRKLDFQNEFFYNGKHWDFAIFVNNTLNTLVEIDGEYNHGLLSDFDGQHVRNQEDYGRFFRANNVKFVAIDSTKLEDGISLVLDTLNIDYEKWIQLIIASLPKEFPYPSYTYDRMFKDWTKLKTYSYKKGQYFTNSIIKNYHKSIYSAQVGNNPSPLKAWNNKELLEKCVRNRFIYSSTLSSQNIVDGFNICKIAPKVSVFNPSLARYLIEKYLKEFSTVFDPFSGFSGRMLGTCSLDKSYIGQDINIEHVKESNQIIKDFKLNASVVQKDIFNSEGAYECLFTCSPYNLKERWNVNETNLSCDEWINICLERFKCNKYLFVVDETEKYKDNIIEVIENKSHFSSNKEFVILLE